jgi:hypothetical protein
MTFHNTILLAAMKRVPAIWQEPTNKLESPTGKLFLNEIYLSIKSELVIKTDPKFFACDMPRFQA